MAEGIFEILLRFTEDEHDLLVDAVVERWACSRHQAEAAIEAGTKELLMEKVHRVFVEKE